MSTDISIHALDPAEYTAVLAAFEESFEPSVSFLQSPVYAAVQQQSGKTVICYQAVRGETTLACGLAVKYDAPLGLSFLYAPYGPLAAAWSEELVRELGTFLQQQAAALGCAFVRWDEYPKTLGTRALSDKLARAASLQPRAEWLIDITPPADDIWMGMHKHARYNVRLAERAAAETKVFLPAQAPLDDFYSLMRTTGSRDSFSIFDRSYYQAYLACLTPESGFMAVCYIDGKPAAAGLFVVHDRQAHYVFAGSSDDYRKIAPAYSVIWAAIKEAKQRGCTLFNFGGISDGVKGQTWAGVTAFKKRFGGYTLTHPNPVDLVVKPLSYRLFTLYKTLR